MVAGRRRPAGDVGIGRRRARRRSCRRGLARRRSGMVCDCARGPARTPSAGELPIVVEDPEWTLVVDGVDPLLDLVQESVLTLADGRLGTSGSVILEQPSGDPAVLMSGVYTRGHRDAPPRGAALEHDRARHRFARSGPPRARPSRGDAMPAARAGEQPGRRAAAVLAGMAWDPGAPGPGSQPGHAPVRLAPAAARSQMRGRRDRRLLLDAGERSCSSSTGRQGFGAREHVGSPDGRGSARAYCRGASAVIVPTQMKAIGRLS
jgi:hypothetical protein